jgi:hypothetical protein
MIKHLATGASTPPEHSMVDVQLIERGSCAPPREMHAIAFNKVDR